MNFLVNFAKFRRAPIFIRTPLEAASEQTTKNHDKNKIMCGSCQSTKQIEKKPASLNVLAGICWSVQFYIFSKY